MLSASSVIQPLVNQYLDSLIHLAKAAQTFCEEKSIEESVLLQSRLSPDMNPLIWQLQMVSEFSARCVARLADIEVPNFPYEENSFADIIVRIEQCKTFVANVDDALIDGGLSRVQSVPLGPEKTMEFRGPIYMNHFFLPNFFFHITTAYNILRHNGLAIGKFDYVGQMPA